MDDKRLTINELVANPMVHLGERVVTLAQVDDVHERPRGTARVAFNRNRARFSEGRHFFLVPAGELRTKNIRNPGNPNVEVILLTERGYLLLVKAFHDDLAWRVQEDLVEAYFRAKQMAQAGTASVQEIVEGVLKATIPALGEVMRTMLAEERERRADEQSIPAFRAREVRKTIRDLAKARTRGCADPSAYRRERGAIDVSLRDQFKFFGAGRRWEMFPLGRWQELAAKLEELRREIARTYSSTQMPLKLA